MDQRFINLYDTFTHGGMNRREFMDRLTKLAGSTAAATALLPLLQNNYAQAAVVAESDPRLVTERIAYDSPKGKINGYLARPKFSTRISRTWRAGSPSRASSATRSICCLWSAARRRMRTRPASCIPR